MKTQVTPNKFQGVLARDSLKKNQMFTVLYDLILFLVIPLAFEMSYVKIFQRSMNAYQLNDVDAMSRLIVYLIIQWFLGTLVRKNYLKVTLKRITLTMLILLQLKEAFFEEVLFDMVISMIMESGFMILFFFKFINVVVILKMAGLYWLVMASVLFGILHADAFSRSFAGVFQSFRRLSQMFMIRIHNCRIHYSWNSLYC